MEYFKLIRNSLLLIGVLELLAFVSYIHSGEIYLRNIYLVIVAIACFKGAYITHKKITKKQI